MVVVVVVDVRFDKGWRRGTPGEIRALRRGGDDGKTLSLIAASLAGFQAIAIDDSPHSPRSIASQASSLTENSTIHAVGATTSVESYVGSCSTESSLDTTADPCAHLDPDATPPSE